MKALSDTKEKILFRRARITELHSIGYTTHTSIAKELGCSRQTVNSDLRVLRRQANNKIEEFQARLPYEYDTMITGVKLLLRRNWEIVNSEVSSERAKATASHIILSCYEKLAEQLRDKYEIMDGLAAEAEMYSPLSKSSLEEQAYREAQEAGRLTKGRVF